MSTLRGGRAVIAAGLMAASLIAATAAEDSLTQPGDGPFPRLDGRTKKLTGSGKQLFTRGEFGGNGRTCETCHSLRTGDVTLEEIQALFADDPMDPMFRAIDSDDGSGVSYERLLTHATFRVFVDLPPNVRLADDPSATRVALFRSTLPTNNIALDPFIMWDGRETNLAEQALNALVTHSEITRQPTDSELQRIADFQVDRLFSTHALGRFAGGGPPPELPEGRTPSERRGRTFFIPTPGVVNCSLCHSGAMLNETLPSVPMQVPAGSRFTDTTVSALNRTGLPVRTYLVTTADGSTVTTTSSDPGRMLVTGNAADANRFKQPTLWGIRNTAPYFHDNSARTLKDVLEHYDVFLRLAGGRFGFRGFTSQDKADIIAFLELL